MLFFSACSTLNDVLITKEVGKGTTGMFDVSPEEAREIAKKSFRWAGTNAREGYEEDDNMLTSSGQNWMTYGSVMGPWIENAGVGKSKVTVISKKKSIHTDSYWYDRWKAS